MNVNEKMRTILSSSLRELSAEDKRDWELMRNRISYLQRRIVPPKKKFSTLQYSVGTKFSCSNYYGVCCILVKNIRQEYHLGVWIEMYEYEVTCVSHTGLDKEVRSHSCACIGLYTAKFHLDAFSKEF